MSMQICLKYYMGHTYSKNLFLVYLKFEFY